MFKSFNFLLGFFLLLNYNLICNCILQNSNNNKIRRKSHDILELVYPKIPLVFLTQKGYIQFLRYAIEVPPIQEFTFCVWINSVNFTYSHPLLSYSKESKIRLIRVWINPNGHDINFSLHEIPIYRVPLILHENEWYHFCTSWDNRQGAWALFINGKLFKKGLNRNTRNMIIPSGGDLVVGQEFTDMDKGLDDGIEGTIFGFNMVLSSVFEIVSRNTLRKYLKIHEEVAATLLRNQRFDDKSSSATIFQRRWRRSNPIPAVTATIPIELPFEMDFLRPLPPSSIPHSAPYSYLPETISFDGKHQEEPFSKLLSEEIKSESGKREGFVADLWKLSRDHWTEIKKSVGYQLIQLTFNHCTLKSGAPLDGDDVLISWTRTPVRVFGGAVLKKDLPFC